MAILSLNEFRSAESTQFSEGTWILEYHDDTHLSDCRYISLGKVIIEESAPNGNCLFRFFPHPIEQLKKSFSDEWQSKEWEKQLNKEQKDQIVNQSERASKTIPDQLGQSMVRLGLLKPYFEIENQEYINKRKFAIIVLDTNALRIGAVRHLHEQLPEIQFWVIIPTVTLMEIGEKSESIKSRSNDKCKPSNSALIRSRPQVTIASQKVKWIKDRFPTETLELAPELLRSFRGYESSRGDAYKEPDRISINDRLILEGIKNLCRQRNLTSEVYLVSGDKDMSRLARLEGIQTIYPEIPDIQGISKGFRSIRYSIESQTYVVCSIHRFLWDLTHIFSKIRMSKCTNETEERGIIELSYYYSTKLINDWVDDKLEVAGKLGSSSIANTA